MAEFTVYNTEGKSVGTIEQPAIFQTPVDEKLIHRYFVWVRSVIRPTLAHTKTRGEVSGGGKKPWRQKGTGRARVGSSRSPIWRKGGIIFGPRKEQTWATRMPRNERRKAFLGALSAKANLNNIVILEDWAMESPKTKEAVAVLSHLPVEQTSKVLHIHGSYDPNLFASTRNLPRLTSTTIQNMNIIDVLNNDTLLMTKDTLQKLDEHFSPSASL